MNKNTIGYISLISLLCIASFFSLNLYFQQRSAHDKVDIKAFPYTIGEWKGTDIGVTEDEYGILETRNLISREYVNPSNDRIWLFIIYSETNRSVFHPPEVCFMGSGVKLLDKKIEKIPYGESFISANKLYTQKSDYNGISLYCYKVSNFHTDNYYLQQAYFALNQLFRRHVRGATIHIAMPLDRDEEVILTELKNLMKESARIIDSL